MVNWLFMRTLFLKVKLGSAYNLLNGALGYLVQLFNLYRRCFEIWKMRAVLRLLFMDEIEKLFIDFLLTLFVIYIELLRFFWWILSLRRFLNLLLLLRAFIIICRGLFLNILGLLIISLNVLTLSWDLHNTILLLERSRLLSTLTHYLGKSLTWA